MKHIDSNAHGHRVWAEIDLGALTHNYEICAQYIRAAKPDAPVVAVIKADAYGHGAAAAVCALYDKGCRHFAVASLAEGTELRHALAKSPAGVTVRARTEPCEILVLGYTDPHDAALLAANSLSQTLISPEYAALLHQYAKIAGVRLTVHVKVDTGMHRIGFAAFTKEQADATAQYIARMQKEFDAFEVRGLFTHLSDADCGDFCLEQWARYTYLREQLQAMGACPPACHVSNGPASLRFPEMYLDGVRVGAPIYGMLPPGMDALSHSPGRNLFPSNQLLPVMRFKTRIIHVHQVAAGEPIGYGALGREQRPRTVATLSVGYADGWLRAFKGASVTVHTAKGDFPVRLVGRICMDLCMADVTDLPVEVGDTVTLFGEDAQSLRTLAECAGTIAYEIPCLVTARVPRIYKY